MTDARPPADDGDVREPGHTRDVGWEIGVQRAVDRPVEAVWALLTGDIGLRAWLGEGAALSPEKGHRDATAERSTMRARWTEVLSSLQGLLEEGPST